MATKVLKLENEKVHKSGKVSIEFQWENAHSSADILTNLYRFIP